MYSERDKIAAVGSIQRIALNEQPEESGTSNAPLLRNHLDLIKNVSVRLEVRVGETELTVADLIKLTENSVLKLNRHVEEPLDIYLDGKLVGRGELVVADDNFGIRITEFSTLDPKMYP
jgi:flagellar motor switch protein FliN/FliY